MVNTQDGEVVLDIDDTAERPISDHDDDTEHEEDAGSQQDMDDSVHAFTGHEGPVYATAWNRNHANMVATGGGDDVAFIWQTGASESSNFEETTFQLRGHSDSVACLQFNSNGNLLATGGLDGQIRIWSTQNGECLRVLDGPAEGIEWLSWHPKGDIVLAGSEDFTVWMWNASTGTCMQVFTGHSGPVRCGGFTPDGKSVVTGGGEADNSLKIWEPRNGACTLTIMDAHSYHTAGLTSLDIRGDSQTVCTGSEDTTVQLVNLQNGRVLGSLRGHSDSIEAVKFVSDSSLLASCSLDGTLRVWETSTFALRATCSHPQGVVGLLSHPLGPFLFTSCLDGWVRSWDARTGECLREQGSHKEGIQTMSISPDGQYALTGSDDHTAKVFEFDFSGTMH